MHADNAGEPARRRLVSCYRESNRVRKVAAITRDPDDDVVTAVWFVHDWHHKSGIWLLTCRYPLGMLPGPHGAGRLQLRQSWHTAVKEEPLLGNVVVRRPGEPEVYDQTADLHERFSPATPAGVDPPLEDDVRMTDEGWGLLTGPGSLFGATIVRWYPVVQWFDGDRFADLLRSTSLYRRLPAETEPRSLRTSSNAGSTSCRDSWPAARWISTASKKLSMHCTGSIPMGEITVIVPRGLEVRPVGSNRRRRARPVARNT